MVEPGYYWFVECSNCKKDIIVRQAPSPEEKERPRKRGVRTRCPFCGKQDTYPASTVQRGVVDSIVCGLRFKGARSTEKAPLMAPEMAVKRLEGREEATGGPRPALRGQRAKAVVAGDLR